MLKAMLATIPFCLAMPAQDPASSWVWYELPDASATVLAVGWRAGYDLDAPGECGASRVLAEVRLERARAAVPGVTASGVHVDGGMSVVFVRTAREQSAVARDFVAALLDDRCAVSDDLIARVVARVALAADDAEWMYPGEVLASRGRAVLLAGTSLAHAVAGSSRGVLTMTPARVRELLQVPRAVSGVGLGFVPAALRDAVPQLTSPPSVPQAASVMPVRIDPLPATLERIEKSDTGAAFVAAAFAVPASVERCALAVGLEVARARAARQMPPRPEEAVARAPRIAWSWLHGDPVIVFCRRGPNGAALDRPRHELERLLADVRTNPPSAEELQSAVQTLQFELALPPWSPAQAESMAVAPASLPERAKAILLARERGIDGERIVGVTAASASAAIGAALVESGAVWFAVVPAAVGGTLIPGGSR